MNDDSYDMIITSDNGYALTGHSESTDGDVSNNNGGWDVFVVRLDKNHEFKWKKTFGGSLNDVGRSILQTPDGGFIVAASSYSSDFDLTLNHGNVDYWVFKVDSSGNLIWQKSFGGSGEDQAYDIALTKDSCYIIAGYTGSTNGDVMMNHGATDFWILKLSDSGNIVWQKSLGGTGVDFAYAMIGTEDGGALITGKSFSNDIDVSDNHGNYDIWVVKVDFSGEIQWQKSLGGSDMDIGLSLLQTSDHGCIVGGATRSVDGDVTANHGGLWDSWAIKLDSSGNMVWQKTYGGSEDEAIEAGVIEVDGGFLLAGWTTSYDGDITYWHGNYDFWLLIVNDTGSVVWERTYGGMLTDQAMAAHKTLDGNIIIAGATFSSDGDVSINHGGMDMWIISVDIILDINSLPNSEFVHVYPNPTNSFINIDFTLEESCVFSLFNILGEEVLHENLKNGNNNLSIIKFDSGVYIYSIDCKSKALKGKIIIN